MVGRKLLIEYACECGAEYGALPEKAGQNQHCRFCNADFTIPVGVTPRLVPVSIGPSQALTPEEEALVRREMEQRRVKPALPVRMQPAGRSLVVPEVFDDDFDGELVAPEPSRPVTARKSSPTRKVKMKLPNDAGEFEAEVTQDTADKLSFAAIGGFLVAIGVFIAAMLGIKKRS